MEALLYLLPALGCGLMMLVMMVFMGRMMSQPRDARRDDTEDVASRGGEVARLRSRPDAEAGVDG